MWVYLYKERETENPKPFFGQYLQIKVLFNKVNPELPNPGIRSLINELWCFIINYITEI